MKSYTEPILGLGTKLRVRVLNLMRKVKFKGICLLMKINERGNCQGEFKIVLRFLTSKRSPMVQRMGEKTSKAKSKANSRKGKRHVEKISNIVWATLKCIVASLEEEDSNLDLFWTPPKTPSNPISKDLEDHMFHDRSR
jgi:hypothetical protein